MLFRSHVRWEELMRQNKGKIDVAMAQQFLSDHYDSYDKKQQPDERTLCGHGDTTSRGIEVWDWDPYYPGGAVQGKATDSDMAAKMQLVARAGHPCGEDFHAKDFLAQHPEYAWQSPLLRDMKAGPWTQFKSGDHDNAQSAIAKPLSPKVNLKAGSGTRMLREADRSAKNNGQR